MKNKLFLFYVAFIFTIQSHASGFESNRLGAGLMLGGISAITGKYWISSQGAVDFGIGFGGRPGTALYADYLWHLPGIFGRGTKFGQQTSGYLGGGGGLAFWNNCGSWNCNQPSTTSGNGIFLRGLVGFEWYPPTTQFGFFAELGPTILISPGTYGAFDIGFGGRYYF
jgi:hypothetical protein